ITRVDATAISAVKSFDPPLSALVGRAVTDAGRHGKFLDLDADGLHLIVHFARAGWLRWRAPLPSAPPKPGRGPLALRVALTADIGGDAARGDAVGFDLTEAGTQKRLAVYLVRDPAEVPGIAALGPDALGVGAVEFAARLRGQRAQLKGALTDQSVLAGIGNAYSDEILHAAKLSPFKITTSLTDAELTALRVATQAVLADAVARSIGQRAATLKGEKRAGLAVHARAGLPCPVCGDLIREVSFAQTALQYCPTCQTGGRALADRRLSRLLK
ncbi:MAG: Fpg/Nei family DNA glycosylase, partial [Actinomycetia bacterium]|nr:Fpg/Nei family DNA glycosylase [Actinomycetes bacterium]